MLRNSTTITLAAAALAMLTGCSTSAEFDPGRMSSEDADPTMRTQMAAFAARDENAYPSTQPSNDLRAAAVVDRENGIIRIYNFTREPITDAKVWVNQTYVVRVPNIPASDGFRISRSRFYNANGIPLSRSNSPVNTVQIERGERLYTLQGPVFE